MTNGTNAASEQHIEAWTWFDKAGSYHLERDEPSDGEPIYQLTPLIAATAEPRVARPTEPVTYHRDDEGPAAAEIYARMASCLDDAALKRFVNEVAHGAKATMGPGRIALTRSDWTQIKFFNFATPSPKIDPVVPAGSEEFGDPRRAMDDTELQEFCIALSFEQDDYTEEVIRAVEDRMLAKPLFMPSPVQAQAAVPRTQSPWAAVPLRMTRAMREIVEEEGWEWKDLLAAAEAITVEQYNEECSDTVAAEWFDSVVRLERMASAAINQSPADQRNILQDIAERLSRMTYAARPARNRAAAAESGVPLQTGCSGSEHNLGADK